MDVDNYKCGIGFQKIFIPGGKPAYLGVFTLFLPTNDTLLLEADNDIATLQIIEGDRDAFEIILNFINSEDNSIITCQFNPSSSGEFIKSVREFSINLKENFGLYFFHLRAQDQLQKMMVDALQAKIIYREYYKKIGEDFIFVNEKKYL